MPRNRYRWNDEELPVIAPHSRRKHRILRNYISKYVVQYATTPTVSHLKLAVVDGFCGGGRYRSECDSSIVEGSPLQLIRGIHEGVESANKKRSERGIQSEFTCAPYFYFIDNDPDAIRALTGYLSDTTGNSIPRNYPTETICAELNNQVDALIAKSLSISKKGRSIWLLDQYGYSQVQFPRIHQILTDLPESEVIFTYAIDMQSTYLDETNLRAFAQRTQLAATNAQVDDFLTSILRHQDPAKRRLEIERRIFEVYRHLGAAYITPFAVHTGASHKSYWLIHLCNHVRAHEVMKSIHWDHANDFAHFGSAGLDMLGYRATSDQEVTGQLSLESTEFSFDEHAKSRSLRALLEQLPRVIASLPSEGVRVRDLIAQCANETPASSSIFVEAINRLRDEGDIEIRGPKGEWRRSASASANDVVRLSRQIRLIFG